MLATDDLMVRADPAHGGEILDLIDPRTGAQYLGRPPFASLPPLAGDLDEDTWTDRYRGGWQTVAPNAGNACSLDGSSHGFHGAASVGAWDVVDRSGERATLAWSGHGLAATRALAIDDGALIVETSWRATGEPVAMVWVEHFTVGVQLLAPGVEIRLPGGRAYELSEVDGPVRPPAEAPAWPEMLQMAGTVERVDRFGIDAPRARFGCVAELPEGWLEVRNTATGSGIAVEWDVRAHPHLWLWEEMRTSGGRWRGQGEMLGLEPASISHSLGLERAVREGQARTVTADEPYEGRIAVRPLHAGGGGRAC